MKSIVLKCRVDPETKERWEETARERGVSLSDLIRASVEKYIRLVTPTPNPIPNGPPFFPVSPSEAVRASLSRPQQAAPSKRRTPCKHGVLPWKRCEQGCDA